MSRVLLITMLAVGAAVASSVEAKSSKVGRGMLFYEGTTVRTLVPPAAAPHEGIDNLYAVGNGADGQLAIAAVAPGDQGYHGGMWAFHLVTFHVSPYLLTSEDAVLAAAASGDVSISRITANDFRCPIQP